MSFDYLPETTLEIKQRKDMFRMNSDTHYLGKFLYVKEDESVLDIGCNNGALLLYASLFNPKTLVGIDYFQEAISLAEENMKHNHVDAVLVHTKIQNFEYAPFDVIVCNPPFFKVDENSNVNESEYLRIARHEEMLTLRELFVHVRRLLKDEGRFYLVHRTMRLTEIVEETLKNGFKIKRMKPIYDENKEYSTSCLFEIVKGKNNQVLVEKPIFITR
ncbi:tRNA1(Val) (adenine(37)-N6)-methyltransferase [Anaerorhabdus sp.]|uniref:tRNA1(Val) (adenine(37)-N6)-methyltransferase n=1 Tax=Anaerorhabdus sp. TaxID=1872524 RepID=UPI002FC9A462